ncbi:hypothetical protein AB0A91_11165 [Streptomyces sp. NPDC042207]|uniref:hypothetical protein n=1 Tax=Streptomyces sp. NPDC042207 TaxID=3154331 RepID=UPI0033F39C90
MDAALVAQPAMPAASLSAFDARSPRAMNPAALVAGPAPDSPPRMQAVRAVLHGFDAAARSDWAAAAESFRCAFALTDGRTGRRPCAAAQPGHRRDADREYRPIGAHPIDAPPASPYLPPSKRFDVMHRSDSTNAV